MPGAIIEFVKSRTLTAAGKASRAERNYRVRGTSDDAEALTLLVGEAPTTLTVLGQLLSDVEYEVADLDEQLFECSATYKRRQPVGETRYSFEITGQTQHIEYSRATIQAVGASLAEFGSAIGFDGETVQGTDIVIPTYSFAEQHVFTPATVTPAYKAALFAACGTVNNASWKGFAAGEVLFLGASGSERDDGNWEISFRFIASKNQTGLSIGTLTGINKKGWEYLWVYFAGGNGTQRYVKKPSAAMVEQVYLTHNFTNIGIGA